MKPNMKNIFRKIKLKSSTKLALFSTGIVVISMIILTVILSLAFDEQIREIQKSAVDAGAKDFLVQPLNSLSPYGVILFFFPILILASSFISSLIIDRALNPVRVMIEKVKLINKNNFNSKIFIDSVDDELKEYAVAFNDMTSRVNEYVEKQKQFISDASHELATPITVIVGHADMLLRWGKDDKDTLDLGLITIKKEAVSMNELIENLLFFARTDNERIQYEMQAIDLTKLLHECIDEQRMIAPDFMISLEHDNPLSVVGDYDALKRVIRILVSNSVKYSQNQREIYIVAKSDDQFVNVSVSDKGIGIDLPYLDKIFDRFFRTDDSRTKETGGTGLGLAIAKEIVDAHDGTILAQSQVGEGTTMTIQLKHRSPSSNLHDETMTYS